MWRPRLSERVKSRFVGSLKRGGDGRFVFIDILKEWMKTSEIGFDGVCWMKEKIYQIRFWKPINFKFPYFVVCKNTKIEVFKCLLFLFLTQKVKSHAPPFILIPKTADWKLVETCIHLWWDETVGYLFKNVQLELIRTHKWFKDLRSWPYKARTDAIACKCDMFYKEVYLTVVSYFAGWTTGCVGWRRLGSTAPTCCCM